MLDASAIICRAGRLTLRREAPEDEDFRFRLFCESCSPEMALLRSDRLLFDSLMRMQFLGQRQSYGAAFPAADYDIIECGDRPIGRIVINRSTDALRLVDLAILPERRSLGFGTALLKRLMADAQTLGLPLQLQVVGGNYAALRFYERLGFLVQLQNPTFWSLEWQPD